MTDAHTTETKNEFNEDRWALLKMRAVAVFASFLYPAWAPVYLYFFPDAYDSFPFRLVATTPCWLVIGLSFRREVSVKMLEKVFNVMALILTYYVFFLVYMNDLSPGYVLGAYCMFFATGGVLSSFRTLGVYYLSCLAISISFWSPQNNAIFLVLGIVSAGGVSVISWGAIHKLLNNLRASRNQVEQVNDALDKMLNALGQGFFSFDASGKCSKVYSKACLTLLESDPSGRNVFDVLKTGDLDRDFHSEFLGFAFESTGKFDLFIEMMPKTFPHSEGRVVALEFKPVERGGVLQEVLVIATDETALVKANQDAETERQHTKMIATIVKEKRYFMIFVRSFYREVETFESGGDTTENGTEFRRFLHSAKGATGLFGIEGIASAIHQMEDAWGDPELVVASRDRSRTQAGRLKTLMNEFLTAHQYIVGSELQSDRTIEIRLDSLLAALKTQDFSQSPASVQKFLVSATLLPIENFFSGFSDLILKMASGQGKKMHPLIFKNGQLPIFPEAYESLLSSFVHVFRNAVDHGLELKNERLDRGKPEAGRIEVHFDLIENSERHLKIVVKDDGRGIDPERIRAKLGPASAQLSNHEVLQKIFDLNFTTRDQVTEFSGRGVGLDALAASVADLGGRAEVSSTLGRGTTFTILVPYLEPSSEMRHTHRIAS